MNSSKENFSVYILLVSIIRKNKTLFNLSSKILKGYKGFIYKAFCFMPINSHRVIFTSFAGKNYSCNPKAIYEEMIKDQRFKEYEYIWVFKDVNKNAVSNTKNIKYGSLMYYYYLATAKYRIVNYKMPLYVKKRKNQIYVQTWHGTPLKRLARDIIKNDSVKFYRSEVTRDNMIESYIADAKGYDYLVSPNKFSSGAFQSAFGVESERIVEIGYPRNDVLVNAGYDYINQIKKKLNIPLDKKIVFYAPTWRDDVYDSKGYFFELKADFNKWKESLGEDYYLIYRPHYLIYNTNNMNMPLNFVFDASKYNEINDLYLISDILITDYSSVFFDYAILKRPILFYMYDLKEYGEKLRGFYLDINKDLPGPIFENEAELLEAVKHISNIQEAYKNRYDEFYEKFCGCHDGRSSKKIIDIVF